MWADIINTIVTLATTGGVVYLIIEKLFERKRSKAETKTVEIEVDSALLEKGYQVVAKTYQSK